MKLLKTTILIILTISVGCSQPTDPSEIAPKVKTIEGNNIILINQLCSLKVFIEDNNFQQCQIKGIWGDDTVEWQENFPTNQYIYLTHTFTETDLNYIYLQAKNPDNITSEWSSPFIILSTNDSLYFSDNFEVNDTNPDTSKWISDFSGDISISILQYDTSKALLLCDRAIGSWLSLYCRTPIADTGDLNFQVLIPNSTSQDTNNVISFRSISYNFNWDDIGMHFGIIGDSLAYKSDLKWYMISQLPKEQWVNIRVCFSNINKKYHIYQDNVIMKNNINFDGSGNNSAYFQILCSSNRYRDTIYFDNINFQLH